MTNRIKNYFVLKKKKIINILSARCSMEKEGKEGEKEKTRKNKHTLLLFKKHTHKAFVQEAPVGTPPAVVLRHPILESLHEGMPWHLGPVGSVDDLPHFSGLITDRLGNLHRLVADVADVVSLQDDFETRGCSRADARFRLLADPQTVGGLVAGVPTARAESCFAALREAGYPYSAVIGEVLVDGRSAVEAGARP